MTKASRQPLCCQRYGTGHDRAFSVAGCPLADIADEHYHRGSDGPPGHRIAPPCVCGTPGTDLRPARAGKEPIMTWMNEYDIDNALERWISDERMGPAVRTLDSLRAMVNANSDGWPYWKAPARAAGRLMALVEQARRAEREQGCQHPATPWPTPEELRKALIPVKRFRTLAVRQYGERANFLITERMPTRRETLGQLLQDAERAAADHARLADRWLARARDIAAELAELDGNAQ